jgi:hypothetical protein
VGPNCYRAIGRIVNSLLLRSDAIFSPCGSYRYTLERTWGTGGRTANFLMLNPSTADANVNDPTVERQCRRVKQWGYDGLVVTNLFAWRSTDPDALLKAEHPIGPENDAHIVGQAVCAELVVCGWGSHKAVGRRGDEVLGMLRAAGVIPHALKVTTGQPWHPLYISYSAVPFPIKTTRPA